tara:strand:+ start:109 stop:1269 length:1161 start_codon:yes stop_codon:yes gene_type:complete
MQFIRNCISTTPSASNLQLGDKMAKQMLSVDDLFYQQEIITTEEWHNEWECCPTQRDHEERAKKPKHQKKFKKVHADHLEVNGVILTKDCVCTETGKEYKAGTKFKTNGHTRDAYWWAEYSGDLIPEKVRVSYRKVDSIAEVIREYKMFDSPDDVELASDRLDGAFRDIFKHRNIEIKDGKLRKVEPIQYAAKQCFPVKYGEMTNTDVTNIRLWVADLEEPILWLKAIFEDKNFGKRKHEYCGHINPFTLSYLVSYMRYKDDPEKLKLLEKFIFRVSNGKIKGMEDEEGDWVPDNNCPCNRFIKDWSLLKTNSLPTVFAAINGTDQSNNMRSFCLLMIDMFVNKKELGILPNNWRSTLSKWYELWQIEKKKRDLIANESQAVLDFD